MCVRSISKRREKSSSTHSAVSRIPHGSTGPQNGAIHQAAGDTLPISALPAVTQYKTLI
jgi:hypothetical protein